MAVEPHSEFIVLHSSFCFPMSEYLFVEKPFLDHLRALGWEVIDQGGGIPSDLAARLRDGFREVTLRCVFCETVRGINLLPDGSPGSRTRNSPRSTTS
jgi:hypothetical protein